ncbi:hypothetical protein IQ22_04251 [Pseudomonas duriflava]|uniref:Uncharacterized protein n=1 Tax=Pseudomonas duriflava TaxID=459528 RepID=A0A562PUI7_9PSED|nr:hypothetical protein [Pseudomonas duriflava]TWI48058.1 hypothetical protein IQ22_04251 [Pseudomonas duriflava]
MESVSHTTSVVTPFISITIALVGLMFAVARATAAERAMVISWIAKTALITVMVIVIAWFSFRMFIFATSSGQPTRLEVVDFSLSFFNVVMYGKALLDYTSFLLKRGDKEVQAKLKQELEEEQRQHILSQAKLYTTQQIHELMEGMNKNLSSTLNNSGRQEAKTNEDNGRPTP